MNVWRTGIAAGLGWLALVGATRAQEPAPAQAPPAQPTARPARGDLPGPIDSLQDIQDTGKMLFKMADTNNDGQISQKEAIDLGNLMVGGFFFRADANGDGTVSQDEARQARDALLAQKPLLRYLLQKGQQGRTATGANANANGNANAAANPLQGALTILDTNNDKQIQATELRQAVQTAVQGVFASADTNRDGQLSPAELNASVAGAIRTASQGAFQAADADRNGQLSREEFDRAIIEPANAVFMMLDVNNDGQLSQDEMRSARRFLVSQLRMFQVPEASNSPRNMIRTGRGVPAEGAPATTLPPGQPAPGAAPGAAPTPGTPR